MVTVLFFGQLRERLNCAKISVEITKQISVHNFKKQLVKENPDWHQWLLDVDIFAAVNQTISPPDTLINKGDEIAFFPPVTGG